MACWVGYRGEEPFGRVHRESFRGEEPFGRVHRESFRGATHDSVRYKTVLSKSDLIQLQRKAKRYASSTRFMECDWLYRNKSHEYFNDILDHKNGIMEVYIKDNNGDPRSPINGQLDGLFFCASVDGTGAMLQKSPFGPRRLCISSSFVFNSGVNLYFADFYCTKRGRPHYVTLVMTKRYSHADRFCQRHLVPLNIHGNDFLYLDYDEQQVYVACSSSHYSRFLVEVFYTDDIDVQTLTDRDDAKFQDTFSTGASTPGGLSKCLICEICNL